MNPTEQKGNFTIREWSLFLFSRWKPILLFSLVCGLLGLGLALLRKVTYKSELTFVLSNEDNNDLSSLTSQFGINLGSNNDAFTGDNIVNLFRSRKMIQWALFQKVPQLNKKLLDIYISESSLEKKIKSDERLKNSLPFPDDPEKLTPIQDSLVRIVHTDIIDNALAVERPDTKLSFFTIRTIYNNEIFSCYFTKYLVDATSKLYIDTKTTAARQNLSMLQAEADSVNKLINGAIAATGAATDQVFNLNPALQVQRAPVYRSQFKATVNQAAYTEIMKNLELAKIALQKQSPIYLILDEPHLPLERIGQGKLYSTLIGLFIGVILGVAFFVLRKLVAIIFDKPSVEYAG